MSTTRRKKSVRRAKKPVRRKPRPARPEALAMPATPGTLMLILGYWISQLVYVAAQLDLADVLAKGPRTAESLAADLSVDPVALARVLRALASVGVFEADARGRYRMTPLAETLRSDHPESLRDFARMMVADYNWHSWGDLLQSVRDGQPAFDRVHGMPFFEFLGRHPEKERVFAASMASISGAENPAIARASPFGRLRRLVDVGGAHGHLLATILRRHGKLRGVLYDQPQVVAGAAERGFVSAPDVRDRIELVGGDFFASVPEGGDGYLMKYILHDWNDERCVAILRHCREAMAPDGRVFAVDHVVPPGNAFDRGKLMDLNMFVLLRGRERTKAEFAELFGAAGLKLRRVIPTDATVQVLEASRA
ncbi:MAG TPA: methyltransferase [Myxococcota bacterium]|nr:methyltransferase [Myxococcota bacterium]